ncbi:MAG: LamG-like jellyroll fold domain-containing protein [Candidatus Pacearchaeota archaeon]
MDKKIIFLIIILIVSVSSVYATTTTRQVSGNPDNNVNTMTMETTITFLPTYSSERYEWSYVPSIGTPYYCRSIWTLGLLCSIFPIEECNCEPYFVINKDNSSHTGRVVASDKKTIAFNLLNYSSTSSIKVYQIGSIDGAFANGFFIPRALKGKSNIKIKKTSDSNFVETGWYSEGNCTVSKIISDCSHFQCYLDTCSVPYNYSEEKDITSSLSLSPNPSTGAVSLDVQVLNEVRGNTRDIWQWSGFASISRGAIVKILWNRIDTKPVITLGPRVCGYKSGSLTPLCTSPIDHDVVKLKCQDFSGSDAESDSFLGEFKWIINGVEQAGGYSSFDEFLISPSYSPRNYSCKMRLVPSLPSLLTPTTPVESPVVTVSAKPQICSDGACTGTETCSSCSQDCGTCPSQGTICGDGACTGTETCSSCSQDCGTCPSQGTICGDGVKTGTEQCDDGNTANNDGCSSSCLIEIGWTCSENSLGRSTCRDICEFVSCDDGNPCNGVETCRLGVCQQGTPLNCDDGYSCTTDSCLVLSNSSYMCRNVRNNILCNNPPPCYSKHPTDYTCVGAWGGGIPVDVNGCAYVQLPQGSFCIPSSSCAIGEGYEGICSSTGNCECKEVKCYDNSQCNSFVENPNSASCGTVEDTAVVAYHFEENLNADPSAQDSSGAPIIVANCYGDICPESQVAGKVNKGFKFNGINDALQVNYNSAFDSPAISVVAWVNLNNGSENRYQSIFAKASCITGIGTCKHEDSVQWTLQTNTLKSDGTGDSYLFGINVGGRIFWAWTNDRSIKRGEWQHVVGVYDGENVTIYLDGELALSNKIIGGAIKKFDGIENDGGADENNPNNKIEVYIGARMGNNFDVSNLQDFFNGTIDEVYFYERSLSHEEVKQLYGKYANLPENVYKTKSGQMCYTREEDVSKNVCIDKNNQKFFFEECAFGCFEGECRRIETASFCNKFDGDETGCNNSLSWTEELKTNIQNIHRKFAEVNTLDRDFCTNPESLPEGVEVICGCEYHLPTNKCNEVIVLRKQGEENKCYTTNIRLDDVAVTCSGGNSQYYLRWDGKYQNPIEGTENVGVGCINGIKTFQCPSKVSLPFFNFFNLFFTLILILISYLVILILKRRI